MKVKWKNSLIIVREVIADTTHTALAKAPLDVWRIASEMGFDTVEVFSSVNGTKMSRWMQKVAFCFKCLFNLYHLPLQSVVLFQHPLGFFGRRGSSVMYSCFRWLLRRRRCYVVSIVHDLAEIRSMEWASPMSAKEDTRCLFGLSDAIILHNEKMIDWCANNGVDRSRLVNLHLFDYLVSDVPLSNTVSFERAVTIAGNMRIEKAPYLGLLKTIGGVEWHLWGNQYDETKCRGPNICYHGVFLPDKPPVEMARGFGLVWDGMSIDTCAGASGNYLRYNNPHKLSLYLAVGMPVIIWNEAAEADLVRMRGVGLVVKSLRDIPDVMATLTTDHYLEMRRNAVVLAAELRRGGYTRAAITAALDKMAERQ